MNSKTRITKELIAFGLIIVGLAVVIFIAHKPVAQRNQTQAAKTKAQIEKYKDIPLQLSDERLVAYSVPGQTAEYRFSGTGQQLTTKMMEAKLTVDSPEDFPYSQISCTAYEKQEAGKYRQMLFNAQFISSGTAAQYEPIPLKKGRNELTVQFPISTVQLGGVGEMETIRKDGPYLLSCALLYVSSVKNDYEQTATGRTLSSVQTKEVHEELIRDMYGTGGFDDGVLRDAEPDYQAKQLGFTLYPNRVFLETRPYKRADFLQ